MPLPFHSPSCAVEVILESNSARVNAIQGFVNALRCTECL